MLAQPQMDSVLIKEHIEVLEKLKGETTNQPIKNLLMEVIKCLTEKIEK